MKTVKYNKGGKLKISQKTATVDPPAGQHWMLENGRYFLMKCAAQQAAIAIAMKKAGKKPKSAKKGMKFNPKYTKGSSNVAERKKLMAQIAAIYDKYRGTKSKRKKKGFPPAVEARLKQLMKRRDKI